MNEFWLWFLRPFGEFLGTVALIMIVIGAAGILVCGWVMYETVKEKFKEWRAKV